MPLAKDLLHPSPEEKRKHKKKRLVQSPSSYFMDVKCPGCYKITTVFSHAQTVVFLQEEKQGLQKDAPPDASSTKSCRNQDEWETIPINIFQEGLSKSELRLGLGDGKKAGTVNSGAADQNTTEKVIQSTVQLYHALAARTKGKAKLRKCQLRDHQRYLSITINSKTHSSNHLLDIQNTADTEDSVFSVTETDSSTRVSDKPTKGYPDPRSLLLLHMFVSDMLRNVYQKSLKMNKNNPQKDCMEFYFNLTMESKFTASEEVYAAIWQTLKRSEKICDLQRYGAPGNFCNIGYMKRREPEKARSKMTTHGFKKKARKLKAMIQSLDYEPYPRVSFQTKRVTSPIDQEKSKYIAYWILEKKDQSKRKTYVLLPEKTWHLHLLVLRIFKITKTLRKILILSSLTRFKKWLWKLNYLSRKERFNLNFYSDKTNQKEMTYEWDYYTRITSKELI
eukprot:bmy_11795T0